MKDRVSTLECNESGNTEFVSEQIRKECETLFQDEADRVRRENNIMIYGLQESENLNIDVRIQEDTEKVKNIIHDEIGLRDIEVSKVIRLSHGRNPSGSRPNKPKPVKVVLANSEQRQKVLMKSSVLKSSSSDNRNIFIAPDLNKKDRAENDKLVAELKKKRSESAAKGENCKWTIRKKKVIKVPGNEAQSTSGST